MMRSVRRIADRKAAGTIGVRAKRRRTALALVALVCGAVESKSARGGAPAEPTAGATARGGRGGDLDDCFDLPSGKLGIGAALHPDAAPAFSMNVRLSAWNGHLTRCTYLSPKVGYQYDASRTVGGHYATLSPALVSLPNGTKTGFGFLPTLLAGGSRAGFGLGFAPTVHVTFVAGLFGVEVAGERVWAQGRVFDAARLHLTLDVGELVVILAGFDAFARSFRR